MLVLPQKHARNKVQMSYIQNDLLSHARVERSPFHNLSSLEWLQATSQLRWRQNLETSDSQSLSRQSPWVRIRLIQYSERQYIDEYQLKIFSIYHHYYWRGPSPCVTLGVEKVPVGKNCLVRVSHNHHSSPLESANVLLWRSRMLSDGMKSN